MDRFPEKLRESRKAKDMNQTELAQAVGLSRRSLFNYENGRAVPRSNVIRKLAETLDVTVEYLTNDDTDDPDANRANEERISAARTLFGNKGAREAEDLMKRNVAFLAGGDVDQEAKDAFFEALMTAYITCKHDARAAFTPKSKRKAQP